MEVVGTSQQLLHLNFGKVWLAPLYSHVVSFKHNDHFPGLAFHHDSYLRPTLFLYLAICRDMNRVAIVGGQNE